MTAFSQSVLIQFKDLSIKLDSIELFDQDYLKDSVFNDTAQIWLDIGDVLGEKVRVQSNQLKNIKVEYSFETSVTIMDEGPHCDLVNWKHYTSDWFELKKLNDKEFAAVDSTWKKWQNFPEASLSELIEAVREECGSEWAKVAQEVSSLGEYPSSIDLSKEMIRISGVRANGQQVIFIVILWVAMGC